jgi:hypothetical protein
VLNLQYDKILCWGKKAKIESAAAVLTDFSWHATNQNGKIYQRTTNYINMPQKRYTK